MRTLKTITDQHLLNRIKYFERLLETKPEHAVYIGDSDAASDAVDQENRYNDEMSEEIEKHIKAMKRLVKKRGLLIKK